MNKFTERPAAAATPFSPARRRLLAGGALAPLAGLLGAAEAQAVQRKSLNDPMKLGVDEALMTSGLARALQRGFSQDTGIAVTLNGGPVTQLLEAVEQGEQDAVLGNASWLEAQLEKQGLVHDRRQVATGRFLLVGPTVLAKALDARRDAVLALQRLAQVKAPFLSLGNGSGTHLAEQSLWRSARVTPDKSWHLTPAAGESPLAAARAQQACMLVEQGAWLAGGIGGYSVLVDGDERLEMPVHVMRSFRANHPAGKLFVGWVAGSKGRRLAAGVRGYRAAD